jgi:hypothetical protein
VEVAVVFSRADQVEAANLLYSRRELPEMDLLRRLLEARLEAVKVNLLQCPMDRVQHHQGQASVYSKLLDELTKPRSRVDG